MSADLEREAWESADLAVEHSEVPQTPNEAALFRVGYAEGYLAAATLREKEIEELRAKLEAVPVAALQSINSFASEYAPEDGDWPTEDEFDQADRWLSTVTK